MSFSSAQAVNMFLACSEHVPRLVFLRNTKLEMRAARSDLTFFTRGFLHSCSIA